MAKTVEKTSWQIVRDALDIAASGNTDPDRVAEIAHEALKEMESLVTIGDDDKEMAAWNADDESGGTPAPKKSGNGKNQGKPAWDGKPGGAHTESAYLAAAKRLHHRDFECEIDTLTDVSFGPDAGAYVAAWIWIPDESVTKEDRRAR